MVWVSEKVPRESEEQQERRRPEGGSMRGEREYEWWLPRGTAHLVAVLVAVLAL
jgi:hypothetical protein